MSDSLVTVQQEGNIAVLTVDDGKVNVFSQAMAERLQQCFAEIDPSIGAVVVTGRPGVFSAGFDLKTIGSGDLQATVDMVSSTVRMTMEVLSFPRPVIGVATGHCVAMGALFLMATDYRIGARGDFRIGLNEVMDGLALPIFAVELPRFRLPVTNLIAGTLHSSLCTPDEAVTAGFLEEAVSPHELMETAMMRAAELARLPNPAYAVSKSNLVRPVRDRILSTLDDDLAKLGRA
ncbi:MAG: crotonase/enoyl-CoA hydratase family protein [Planctomycetaceae bacterium]|nr:crotonase/enoyl-CoA hydratase family protein [Planctomycetaceae bacterium]